MPYRRPLRHVYWMMHHLALLALWGLIFLPSCLQASFRAWGDDLAVEQPDHAIAAKERIDAHLSGAFQGYDSGDVLHDHFKIIALSHMAYGYMNLASARPEQRAQHFGPHITEVTARALDARTSPFKRRPEEVKDFGDHNLYASHLNLILGIHRHITGDTTHDALHTRLSKHLRKMSLRDGDAHARSYPRPRHLKERATAYKWPADQSVTLLSLFMYDRTRDATLSKEPIKAWLGKMKSASMRDKTTGLPLPTLDKKSNYARSPRGCALSWTVLYMHQFAPKQAVELYGNYRSQYGADVLGFGGFREWPPGEDRGMDVDSGPIVLGVGVAATGLGVGPARMMKDSRHYALAMRSATTFGLPTLLLPERHYLSSPLLGEAILFGGVTATPWFEDLGHEEMVEPMASDEPWPVGNLLLMLILAGLIYYSLSSVREQWRAWRR